MALPPAQGFVALREMKVTRGRQRAIPQKGGSPLVEVTPCRPWWHCVTLRSMPRKPSARTAALTDDSVRRALRYVLELGLEWQIDRAAYEDGAAVLANVAALLENHRERRVTLRRKALLAELVGPLMELLEQQAQGGISRVDMATKATKWLRRAGVHCTEQQAASVLDTTPPRTNEARARTRRERLSAKLAELVGASPSDFEKTVDVAARATENPGRLGNALLRERAAVDGMSGRNETLVFVMGVLDIDAVTVSKVMKLLPREQMDEDVAERERAATLLAAGLQLKAARRESRGAMTKPKPKTRSLPASEDAVFAEVPVRHRALDDG